MENIFFVNGAIYMHLVHFENDFLHYCFLLASSEFWFGTILYEYDHMHINPYKLNITSAYFLDNCWFRARKSTIIRIICIIDFVHNITILYIWLIYSRYGVKHQNNRSIVYVTHDSLPLFKFVVFDHECLLFDVCCFWTWIFVICWLLFLNMNICYFLIIVFKH